ncbi:hypothetical protein PLUA15_190118 [Pseudomonas lundensis]|uniref:Uncharacterized protein n=1 Tax=Pseudomonas lundensis TaxID=86185 RepID=A0AAX2H4H2_9PSED|nr:hypothetical protein PLUA15_190118 [Pseudomonas lundensis]
MDEYTRPCAPWTWTDSIELIEAFGFCSEWPRNGLGKVEYLVEHSLTREAPGVAYMIG